MKALVVDAEWAPREGYTPSATEEHLKRARVGSQVWRHPLFTLADLPTPDVGHGEVLIRVKRCGVCGSDTHLVDNDPEGYIIFSGPVRLPCTIGHEYAGVVERVGDGVRTLRVGDRVAVESVLWCGVCTPCRSGMPNQCENVELTGITVPGALAETIRVHERHCWNLNSLMERYDEGTLFDFGALIEPVGCAYNGMFIAGGGFRPGATVVVFGAGPIGLGAVAMARLAGAGLIIAFDTIASRLEIARELGADHCFTLEGLKQRGGSAGDMVMELTHGQGAEMHVEAAGAGPVTVPEMERSLAVNGKIIYLGRAATKTLLTLDVLVTGANGIIGARGHAGYGIFPNIIRLMALGRLNVGRMITAHFDLPDVLAALRQSQERKDGKIMVRIPS